MKRSTLVDKERNLYKIKYNFFDIFSHAKMLFCKFGLCKCKQSQKSYLSNSEYIYLECYDLMEQELSDYEVLKCMKKYSAALSSLIKTDKNVSEVKQSLVD